MFEILLKLKIFLATSGSSSMQASLRRENNSFSEVQSIQNLELVVFCFSKFVTGAVWPLIVRNRLEFDVYSSSLLKELYWAGHTGQVSKGISDFEVPKDGRGKADRYGSYRSEDGRVLEHPAN